MKTLVKTIAISMLTIGFAQAASEEAIQLQDRLQIQDQTQLLDQKKIQEQNEVQEMKKSKNQYQKSYEYQNQELKGSGSMMKNMGSSGMGSSGGKGR